VSDRCYVSSMRGEAGASNELVRSCSFALRRSSTYREQASHGSLHGKTSVRAQTGKERGMRRGDQAHAEPDLDAGPICAGYSDNGTAAPADAHMWRALRPNVVKGTLVSPNERQVYQLMQCRIEGGE
jgi:hypothetical protein